MDVRIGVTQAPREINVEVDDGERAAIEKSVEAALGGAADIFWITDKRGRRIAVPAGEDRLRRDRHRRQRPAHRLRGVTTQLLDKQLIFVTGKGGVGKTSVAAALAYLAAGAGKRTLVCEMDAKGALAAALDVATLEFTPRLVQEHLEAMAMDTEHALREYLKLFVRVPLVGRLGPLARTFDFVADAAPGVKEILGVGKLAYEVREQSLRPRRRRRRGERPHRRRRSPRRG